MKKEIKDKTTLKKAQQKQYQEWLRNKKAEMGVDNNFNKTDIDPRQVSFNKLRWKNRQKRAKLEVDSD